MKMVSDYSVRDDVRSLIASQQPMPPSALSQAAEHANLLRQYREEGKRLNINWGGIGLRGLIGQLSGGMWGETGLMGKTLDSKAKLNVLMDLYERSIKSYRQNPQAKGEGGVTLQQLGGLSREINRLLTDVKQGNHRGNATAWQFGAFLAESGLVAGNLVSAIAGGKAGGLGGAAIGSSAFSMTTIVSMIGSAKVQGIPLSQLQIPDRILGAVVDAATAGVLGATGFGQLGKEAAGWLTDNMLKYAGKQAAAEGVVGGVLNGVGNLSLNTAKGQDFSQAVQGALGSAVRYGITAAGMSFFLGTGAVGLKALNSAQGRKAAAQVIAEMGPRDVELFKSRLKEATPQEWQNLQKNKPELYRALVSRGIVPPRVSKGMDPIDISARTVSPESAGQAAQQAGGHLVPRGGSGGSPFLPAGTGGRLLRKGAGADTSPTPHAALTLTPTYAQRLKQYPEIFGGVHAQAHETLNDAIGDAFRQNQSQSRGGRMTLAIPVQSAQGEKAALTYIHQPAQLKAFYEAMVKRGTVPPGTNFDALLDQSGIKGRYFKAIKQQTATRQRADALKAAHSSPVTFSSQTAAVYNTPVDAIRSALSANRGGPKELTIAVPWQPNGNPQAPVIGLTYAHADPSVLRTFFDAMQKQRRIPEAAQFETALDHAGITETYRKRLAVANELGNNTAPIEQSAVQSPQQVDQIVSQRLQQAQDQARQPLRVEHTVANRAEMALKIAPLIRQQLQYGSGMAGLDLSAVGTGPSIAFSDGFGMSVHEIPVMARHAGMPPESTLVLVRDGMSGVLSVNSYDTYLQFVWASQKSGLNIIVHSDGQSLGFTPNMNPRPSW